jgi:hypothetical protein
MCLKFADVLHMPHRILYAAACQLIRAPQLLEVHLAQRGLQHNNMQQFTALWRAHVAAACETISKRIAYAPGISTPA